MKREGFTIFELVIVLAISVILLTMGTIGMRGQEALVFEAAVQRVVSDIVYAQMSTVDMRLSTDYNYLGEEGNYAVIDFSDFQQSGNPNSYRCVFAKQGAEGAIQDESVESIIYTGILENNAGRLLEIIFDSDEDYKGVIIESVNFGNDGSGGQYNSLRFEGPLGRPMGGVWIGGQVAEEAYFAADSMLPEAGGEIILKYNDRRKRVRISPIGRVSIENI